MCSDGADVERIGRGSQQGENTTGRMDEQTPADLPQNTQVCISKEERDEQCLHNGSTSSHLFNQSKIEQQQPNNKTAS